MGLNARDLFLYFFFNTILPFQYNGVISSNHKQCVCLWNIEWILHCQTHFFYTQRNFVLRRPKTKLIKLYKVSFFFGLFGTMPECLNNRALYVACTYQGVEHSYFFLFSDKIPLFLFFKEIAIFFLFFGTLNFYFPIFRPFLLVDALTYASTCHCDLLSKIYHHFVKTVILVLPTGT